MLTNHASGEVSRGVAVALNSAQLGPMDDGVATGGAPAGLMGHRERG
jgi:hypothetical protein